MNHAQLLTINSIHSLALAKFLPGDRLISTELSEDLESFNITIDELLAMSLSDVQDECDFLKEIPNSNELLDIYNHASLLKINLLSQNNWKESEVPTVTPQQAIATVAKPTLTAAQLAANDARFPEILENFLLDIKFDITQIDDIVLAIASHEVEQTEATRLEVVATAYRAQLPGIWKQIQAFKNLCQPYKDLLAEVIDNATHAEIELQPTNDFPGSAFVRVLDKANAEKVTDIGGKALVEAIAATDKALDAVKAVATTSKAKAAKVSKALSALCKVKGVTVEHHSDRIDCLVFLKDGEELTSYMSEDYAFAWLKSLPDNAKAPKAAKTPKAKPTLPMPTIADLAALEAMSRSELMKATQGVNSNFVTGVRANAASVELKRVLARHVLNTEYIEVVIPKVTKESKAFKVKLTRGDYQTNISHDMWVSDLIDGISGFSAHVEKLQALGGTYQDDSIKLELVSTKAPKQASHTSQARQAKASKSKTVEAIAIPEGLTFAGVKAMKYRELQKLAGILRSNGKFEGNIGGKGATTEALLSGICKGLGFDTVHVPAASPSRKPLEGNAFRAKYCPNLTALATEAVAA